LLLLGSCKSIPDEPTPTQIPAVTVPNLLWNRGFEGGWTRDTLWWDPDGGPYSTAFGEIATPAGWTTWFLDRFPCSGDYVTGRPEAKVITTSPDPSRVRSGAQAVQLFTTYRCHWAGYLQRATVVPGADYAASAYVHSWYTRCSDRPHDSPLDWDCVTAIDWAHDVLRIGLDPAGGVDPRSSSVVWSAPAEIYGAYGPLLVVGPVRAQGETMTIFLQSRTTHPLRNNDYYADHTRMWRVYRYWLPQAMRDGEYR
jgi:hypothetical protein